MRTNIHTALKAVLQNRVQALLTLCSMSVGVAMVVIVSGLGRGAQLTIESQIESAGPTQIVIRSGNLQPAAIVSGGEQDSGGGEVSEGVMSDGASDAQANLPTIIADARPNARRRVELKNRASPAPLADAEMRLLKEEVEKVRAVAGTIAGNMSLDANAALPARVVRLNGFDAAWPEMKGWRLAQGRWISESEHLNGAPVAIVTPAVAQRLWPTASDPLGQSLKIGGRSVRVVGVLGRGAGEEASVVVPAVHVPLSLARSLLKRQTYDAITVRTASVAVTTSVANEIKARLRQLHELPADTLDDFRVETQSVSALPTMGLDPRIARAVHSNVVELEQASWEEMARSFRQAGRTFTLLLAAAASVCLVVSGIGVMNIMLVSVTARTREIGLRMAMGARARDVMQQFLVEAVTLAAIGGVIGLVLGALGLVLAKYGLHWATAVSPAMLGLAMVMAAATGIAFGFGPARRAAVLDPVVALRSE